LRRGTVPRTAWYGAPHDNAPGMNTASSINAFDQSGTTHCAVPRRTPEFDNTYILRFSDLKKHDFSRFFGNDASKNR